MEQQSIIRPRAEAVGGKRHAVENDKAQVAVWAQTVP